jgi:WD40 repeat protein
LPRGPRKERAIGPSIRDPKLRVLRVWDLPSGQGRTYSLAHLTDESWFGFDTLRFGPDDSLYAAGAGAGGVVRLILPTDDNGTVSSETLYAAGASGFDLSADGRKMLVWASRTPGTDRFEELLVLDLVDHTKRRIATHGRSLWIGAIDASGRAIVTGDVNGTVRVGPISGEEPHLLLGGHTGVVWSVAISPDGRWIASVGDEAIQLWPTPDVTKPPLHTLPHEKLMAKLDALTNLRVVRDPTAATGWKLDVGPLPGWKDALLW